MQGSHTLCTKAWPCHLRHLDLRSDGVSEPVKSSQLQISCVFEAAHSGSRVRDNVRLEVRPPPPTGSPGWEVVRDSEATAVSPERRECMRRMEGEPLRERATDSMG